MSSNPFARPHSSRRRSRTRRLAAMVLGALAMGEPARAEWAHVDLPRADVTLRAAAIGPDGRMAVSGSKATVALSEDGGRTWRLAGVPGSDGLDLRGLALTGPRGAVLMSAGDAAAGQARLFRTDDGGTSWSLAYETKLAGAFLDTVAFWDARNGLVLGDPVDGGWFLLRTSDGGRSWARAAATMPALLPGEAAFAASNSALFLGPRGQAWIVSGGTANGRVFRSRDFGRTWRAAGTPIAGGPTGGVFGGLALGGARVAVVGGDHKDELRAGPGIALSPDAGATWTTPPQAGAPRLLEGLGRLDARTLIAVGPRGTSVSRDDGKSWTQVDAEAFHAIACAHGRCIAAGAKGRVAVWR